MHGVTGKAYCSKRHVPRNMIHLTRIEAGAMIETFDVLPDTRRTASVSPKYVPSPNSWYGHSLEGRLSGLLIGASNLNTMPRLSSCRCQSMFFSSMRRPCWFSISEK